MDFDLKLPFKGSNKIRLFGYPLLQFKEKCH